MPQLLDLLVGREQVTLDTIGQEIEKHQPGAAARATGSESRDAVGTLSPIGMRRDGRHSRSAPGVRVAFLWVGISLT